MAQGDDTQRAQKDRSRDPGTRLRIRALYSDRAMAVEDRPSQGRQRHNHRPGILYVERREGVNADRRLGQSGSTSDRRCHSCYDRHTGSRYPEAVMADHLTRRSFGKVAAGAALAAAVPHGAARAAASDNKVLRFIAQSDLRVLDPVWTTAYITRNHGYSWSHPL